MKDEGDSSSEEDDQMLREALDPQMFSVAKMTPREDVDSRRVHSYKDNILNVTPEFQNFVSKRLLSLLDNTIDEYESKECDYISDQSAGIRLFNNSETVLESTKFVDIFEDGIKPETSVQKRRNCGLKRKSTSTTEKELSNREKIREAAVSPEWILNGEGVKGWSKPRGQVFSYRRNKDGVLELKDPPS